MASHITLVVLAVLSNAIIHIDSLHDQADLFVMVDCVHGIGDCRPMNVTTTVSPVMIACWNKHYDENGPRDCFDVQHCYPEPGIYRIHPEGSPEAFDVYCEDGWTFIMRRDAGSVPFYRPWDTYKEGFGSLHAEHWLGNDHIHYITYQTNRIYKVKFDVNYWSPVSPVGYAFDVSFFHWLFGITSESCYTEYNQFSIADESSQYALHIWGYGGTCRHDGMQQHSGRAFSTWDHDNDLDLSRNCAELYKGAFWYVGCHNHAHPMGMYQVTCTNHECIEWGVSRAVKQMVIKIKPSQIVEKTKPIHDSL